jgi:hypothetical protein
VVLDSADSHAATIGVLQIPFDEGRASRSNQRGHRRTRGNKNHLVTPAQAVVQLSGFPESY